MEGAEKYKYPENEAINRENDDNGYFLRNNPANSAAKTNWLMNKHNANTLLIMIVGAFALGIGFYQVFNVISNPFASLIDPVSGQTGSSCAGGDCELQDQLAAIVALQNKDTDKDGLSDYDEANKYATSPYIADSDSDGISDGDEVKQNTDPNCPTGQNCFRTAPISTSSAAVPTFQSEPPQTSAPVITPETLRIYLKNGGVPAEQVDSLTDAELLALYQETLSANPDLTGQMQAVPSAVVSSGAAISPDTSKINFQSLNLKSVDDLKNLTGAQIRTMMIQAGAPEAILRSVSDEELKSMFMSKLDSGTGAATSTD